MLRHPGGVYTDWTIPSWAYNLKMDEHFDMQNGVVSVKEAGLYFVYVQVSTYKIVFKNNVSKITLINLLFRYRFFTMIFAT